MAKKRVAVIVPGGIGVGHFNEGVPALEALLQALAKQYDLTVFPLGRINADYEPQGFTVKALRDDYHRPLLWRAIQTAVRVLANHLRSRFRLIHGFWGYPAGFLAVLLGKVLGIRSIVSLQGGELVYLPEIDYGQRPDSLQRRLLRWSLQRADQVTTLTTFQRDLLPEAPWRERVRVIPYGVDPDIFCYRECRSAGTWRFVHIANLNPVKDQLVLLECFQKIHREIDCRLTIIGPDFLNGQLQAFVREQGLEASVNFTGYVRHHRLPEYLHEAHILLHTSRHEAMAVVVAEAMATGTLVCGTQVGLIADLAPDCCLAAPVGNADALAQRVLALLSDEARQQSMRQNARRWSQQHPINWTVQQFAELYKN